VAHLSLAEDDGALPVHAEASRRLADFLAQSGEWPEAMQSYQEATDSYGKMPGFEDEANQCARRIRDGVHALRFRPQDRLRLLTVRYERELLSLKVQGADVKLQADCQAHIAGILHRCGRFTEAVSRYEAAIDAYGRAEDAERETARTAMQLGDLYCGPLADDIKAFSLYRRAESLLSSLEAPEGADERALLECRRKLRALGTNISDLGA
jgi:tetratricopeptide (TPR) repeat protein